jgi:predicted DNA-binding transcriptional regulator YafY
VGSAPSPSDRVDVAVAILRRSPGISAAALADALRDRGHEVSVRTAQRIKAEALSKHTVADDGTAA